MYSLGNKIKELRTNRGLTQETLAQQFNDLFGTNINKSMISKWENNVEEPSLDNGRKIVAFFGITLDDLLGLNLDSKDKDDNLKDIAAQCDGEDWTEEELEVIRSFKELIKSWRPKK
ncbi:helix-turn-helix domain-containing protein [Cohnella sp. LGH]|uniref:helix-turn-helix domain-containing protein n=1 Tax=Cohnella sp. LGH TaxID=1619153 RepID=UPI001FFE0991|nr:helix-turn-helix transcriptional regulator [Cohnella sp. LGH]